MRLWSFAPLEARELSDDVAFVSAASMPRAVCARFAAVHGGLSRYGACVRTALALATPTRERRGPVADTDDLSLRAPRSRRRIGNGNGNGDANGKTLPVESTRVRAKEVGDGREIDAVVAGLEALIGG